MSAIGSTGASTPASQPGSTTPATTPAATARALAYAPFAASPALAEVASGARTLGFGDAGPHVRLVLEALTTLGYAATGDRITRPAQAALSRFQRDRGLPGSGVVDAETLAALDAQASRPAPSGGGGGRIAAALRTATADGVLDRKDVGALFSAAGEKVSASELQEIRAAALNQAGGFRVADDAKAEALSRAAAANITSYGNVSRGTPVQDLETGTIRARRP